MADPKDDKFNIKDFLKSKLRWEDFLNGNVQKKYKPNSSFWVFWGLFQMLVIAPVLFGFVWYFGNNARGLRSNIFFAGTAVVFFISGIINIIKPLIAVKNLPNSNHLISTPEHVSPAKQSQPENEDRFVWMCIRMALIFTALILYVFFAAVCSKFSFFQLDQNEK